MKKVCLRKNTNVFSCKKLLRELEIVCLKMAGLAGLAYLTENYTDDEEEDVKVDL